LDTTLKQRLDQLVFNRLENVSRSSSAKLIEQGKVTVNGKIVTKPGQKIHEDDGIDIDFSDKDKVVAQINLPIIYEDDDCIVIDKPLGVLSHSKGAFNPEATVASWLSQYLNGISGERAGIVHRLDRLTSGVMVCAKNDRSQAWLQKQFSQRKTKKTYVAIVSGKLTEDVAVIDMPIERNPKKPQTFRVGINGKSAVTAYKLIKQTDRYTMLELKPTTGRTHQLRVHLKQLGHSIVGDPLYGGEKAERMFLHAFELELTLPNKQRKIFKSRLPKSFNAKMKA
jgi:23S rRNA pseudouridine1911/1915/1917 synthase